MSHCTIERLNNWTFENEESTKMTLSQLLIKKYTSYWIMEEDRHLRSWGGRFSLLVSPPRLIHSLYKLVFIAKTSHLFMVSPMSSKDIFILLIIINRCKSSSLLWLQRIIIKKYLEVLLIITLSNYYGWNKLLRRYPDFLSFPFFQNLIILFISTKFLLQSHFLHNHSSSF